MACRRATTTAIRQCHAGFLPTPRPGGGTLTFLLPWLGTDRPSLRTFRHGPEERQERVVSPTARPPWTGRGVTQGRTWWSPNPAIGVVRPSPPAVMLGGWTFHRPDGGKSSSLSSNGTSRRVFSTTGSVNDTGKGTRDGSPTNDDIVVPLPLPSLTKSATQTAFDYFNHPYFFHRDQDRILFENWFTTLDETTRSFAL